MSDIVMTFKDAPVGARFKFIEEGVSEDIYVKINDHAEGLVVQWNGNKKGYQSHCCWIDEENGYTFDTEILILGSDVRLSDQVEILKRTLDKLFVEFDDEAERMDFYLRYM